MQETNNIKLKKIDKTDVINDSLGYLNDNFDSIDELLTRGLAESLSNIEIENIMK